jgi:hypothetical protein
MFLAKYVRYLIAFVLLTPEDYDALGWEVVPKVYGNANDLISALSFITEMFFIAL